MLRHTDLGIQQSGMAVDQHHVSYACWAVSWLKANLGYENPKHLYSFQSLLELLFLRDVAEKTIRKLLSCLFQLVVTCHRPLAAGVQSEVHLGFPNVYRESLEGNLRCTSYRVCCLAPLLTLCWQLRFRRLQRLRRLGLVASQFHTFTTVTRSLKEV